MFVFLLAPFDTCDCYYFKLNLSLVPLIKVLCIKKASNVIFGLLNMTLKNNFEIILSYELLCLTRISLGRYCRKYVVKSGRYEKKGGSNIVCQIFKGCLCGNDILS